LFEIERRLIELLGAGADRLAQVAPPRGQHESTQLDAVAISMVVERHGNRPGDCEQSA
jgi:hypothetical protein